MAFPHSGPKSPSEALVAQPPSTQSIDKDGQHIAKCLFSERGPESPLMRHLRSTLFEYYVHRSERQCLPRTWNCPLMGCDRLNGTFWDTINHLKDCQHLKASTREYICPHCETNVEMPSHTYPGSQTMGHGKKTMLKIKCSFESLLGHHSPRGRPSSAGSLSMSSYPLDAAPLLEYAAGESNVGAQISDSWAQNKLSTSIPPTDTQLNLFPNYETYPPYSCISPTATNSSYGSWLSNLSPEGPSSAASSSQSCLSPTDSAWFGSSYLAGANASTSNLSGLSYGSTLIGIPEDGFLQDATSMGGMMLSLPSESHNAMIYGGVEHEHHTGAITLHQDPLSQREFPPFTPEIHTYPPVDDTTAAEPSLDPHLDQDLSSPTSTDPMVLETPPTSESCSPTASNSPTLKCEICGWKPDTRVKRPLKKLQVAVEKHTKRNHHSQNHQCKVCKQSFRNRLDNVKPHIKRKHPKLFEKLYPKTGAVRQQLDVGMQGEEKAAARTRGVRRKVVMSLPTPETSPVRTKHSPFKVE